MSLLLVARRACILRTNISSGQTWRFKRRSEGRFTRRFKTVNRRWIACVLWPLNCFCTIHGRFNNRFIHHLVPTTLSLIWKDEPLSPKLPCQSLDVMLVPKNFFGTTWRCDASIWPVWTTHALSYLQAQASIQLWLWQRAFGHGGEASFP